MLTFEHLTKRYGPTTALDDVTCAVAPGQVTALLGPNGAGKSTLLRLVLGLDRPTAGRAMVDGRPYAHLRRPITVVGALLDARAVHPGRSARQHLIGLARAGGVPTVRVDEVLDEVGLSAVSRRRAGGFSLGMAQRLGLAAALLGDPAVLVLDEPINGLDTDGVRWIRELLREQAAAGRTVLLASHLLAEVHQTADHVLVLHRGRLVADCSVADLVGSATRAILVKVASDVATDDREGSRTRSFADLLRRHGLAVDPLDDGTLRVVGASIEAVGDLAHASGGRVHLLAPEAATLEAAYRHVVGLDTDVEAV